MDGNSSVEHLTIICSPHKLPELVPIESNDISVSQWVSIQDKLIQKSQIFLPHQEDKPISIGGTVRGVDNSTIGDAFFKKLQIYSGKGLLVRKYEFKVKK